jgi:hypothetical protein
MTATTIESPTLLLCPACGYDLRGIEGSENCPECGTAIDRGATGTSRIPWVRRKQIGTWRAYVRTVLLVMFRPARIASDIARPVSFDEARRFARRTAIVAWTPMVLFFLWLWLASMKLPVVPVPPLSRTSSEWRWQGGAYLDRNSHTTMLLNLLRLEVGNVFSLGFALEVLVMAVVFASLLLWVTCLCRAGSWFFHPRDQSIARQNRAVALSHYACAPLALTPLVAPFVAYTYWSAGIARVWGPHLPGIQPQLALLGYALPLLLLTWLWACNLLLLWRTIGCGAGRVITMAATLPVIWAALTAVAVSLPAGVLLLALMLLSVVG